MRPMLCSIYTNIFEFHQQRSWSTIIYWLSERKNATYHAIEYQLSLEVFVFQHFRKKPEILPKISVKWSYNYLSLRLSLSSTNLRLISCLFYLKGFI